MVQQKQHIWVTPFGGHGTSYIARMYNAAQIKVNIRPDYIFSYGIDGYDMNSFPVWDEKFVHHQGDKYTMLYHRGEEWERRTSCEAWPNKTIGNCLLDLLLTTPYTTILFGKQSINERWLTNHNIGNLILMVRHPLDAYDSFFGRRHPAWARHKGGIRTVLAAEYWATQWNRVVDDFLETGYPILRYENLVDDLMHAVHKNLSTHLRDVWYNKPTREFINPKTEEFIKQLTWNNFREIYKHW